MAMGTASMICRMLMGLPVRAVPSCCMARMGVVRRGAPSASEHPPLMARLLAAGRTGSAAQRHVEEVVCKRSDCRHLFYHSTVRRPTAGIRLIPPATVDFFSTRWETKTAGTSRNSRFRLGVRALAHRSISLSLDTENKCFIHAASLANFCIASYNRTQPPCLQTHPIDVACSGVVLAQT
jgi:hypothetical protein